MTNVAINILNIRKTKDFNNINRLIEWLGRPSDGRSFLLIGHERQKDLLVTPPRKFSYYFAKSPDRNFDSDPVWMENSINSALENFNCNLIIHCGGTDLQIAGYRNIVFMTDEYTDLTKSPAAERDPSGKKLKMIRKPETVHPDGIIFTSGAVKNGIRDRMANSGTQTTVVYPGVDRHEDNDSADILEKYDISNEYFVAVASVKCLRQLKRLLCQFSAVFGDDPDAPELVVVSIDENTGNVAEIIDTITVNAKNAQTRFLGKIPDEYYIGLFKCARAFILPKFMKDSPEILTAAVSCGCAVVSPNDYAAVEITDGAALYFDPENLLDLALKLKMVFTDRELVNHLIKLSESKSGRYGWEKTAAGILGFIDLVAGRQSRAPESTSV